METNSYIGKQFGSYRLVEKLDSGGFGSVYLARHVVLSARVVAVKLLHSMYLDSQEVQDSFLEEARLLEVLKHRSILPILDINIAKDGFPYLITEYASGGSLRAKMRTYKTQPLVLSEALSILSQVGAGLSYAHEHNIIHRDLKPENILFNEKGEALLADFGLATTLATASEKYVSASGTPAYMAPEQFKGMVSKESDQYALGCIAYELFTGYKIFQGNSAVEMMYQHLLEKPVLPSKYNAALELPVEEILLKAVAKTRQERFSSVAGFIQALEKAVLSKDTHSHLATAPVLSLMETKLNPEVALSGMQWADAKAISQESEGADKEIKASNQQILQATVEVEKAAQIVKVEIPEGVALMPTRVIQQDYPPLDPIVSSQKRLSGSSLLFPFTKTMSSRWLLSAGVILIMLALIILAPMISSNLSQAKGVTTKGKTRTIVGSANSIPTITPANSSFITVATEVIAKKTPTASAIINGVPTSVPTVVPTETLAPPTAVPPRAPTVVPPRAPIVPPRAPTVVPPPAAQLLASKSSIYAEDDCSWSDNVNLSNWSCTEILSDVSGAANNVTWSSTYNGNTSVGYHMVSFTPSSGTLAPGQSVTVSVSIDDQGRTSCPAGPSSLIFTGSTNTLTIPWRCSGPLPTVSPNSLGGTNHAGCSADSTGANWLCVITITPQKQGLDTWGISSSGLSGITFDNSGGYFGIPVLGGTPLTASVTATIPQVPCPASATITILTSFNTFTIPWSC